MALKNGGSAFPKVTRLHPYYASGYHGEGDKSYEAESEDGMTLRDYFAAKALVALMSNQQWVAGLDSSLVEIGGFKPAVAAHAYALADAMLREREKGGA